MRLAPLLLLLVPALMMPAVTAASPDKVPVTTSSDAAKQLYLDGRDLFDKLRFADSRELFSKAVEADPNFALAHFSLASTANTTKEFWDALGRAVELAPNASGGEQRMILGFEAGVKSNPDAQRRYYKELVREHPSDERAHNLLGNYHTGRQDYEAANAEYEAAITINPEYSAPYNSLGYNYRALERYDDAEAAFKKYIELIPAEPNPYDSYAELLMKMGRFEESIVQYRKALDLRETFVPSYVGIGNNHMFMGRYDEARASFDALAAVARNIAEERQAIQWTAVSHLHEGNYEKALEKLKQQHDLSAEGGDLGAMAGDLTLMGTVYLHWGDADAAIEKYRASVALMEKADVPEESKATARRNLDWWEARVALEKDDLALAKKKSEAYGKAVAAKRLPFEVWRTHELAGRIALQEKDHARAVAELAQANQQNPEVLYFTALAHEGLNDKDTARTYCRKAANFNGLAPTYAYVRREAQDMLQRVQVALN